MALKEQKLFFTRNNEYTVWEMLNHLEPVFLDSLLNYVVEKTWVNTSPGQLEEYASFFYMLYDEKLPEEEKGKLHQKIEEYFSQMAPPKSDFNAFMYHYQATSMDMASALANLGHLKQNLENFEIDGLEMEHYSHNESNGITNVIDIRFTSPKSTFYKQNKNIQIVNTEIRVYLDLNIILLTNFSQYTHNDSEKQMFIENVIERVSTHRGSLHPIKMSDQALRNLLSLDSRLPSKMKFDVEGRFKVKFDIYEDNDNFANNDEIRQFYDKYSLSLLKVKISEGEEEKYLTINGPEGKLYSRTQNMDIEDIDNFVKRLSMLLRYDYLNDSYISEIKLLAVNKLTGTTIQKNNTVDACYRDVELTIKNTCSSSPPEIQKLIKNAFFFCLSKDILLGHETHDIILNSKTARMLSRATGKRQLGIEELFSKLISLYNENKNDLGKLILSIDELIRNDQGMIRDASGL